MPLDQDTAVQAADDDHAHDPPAQDPKQAREATRRAGDASVQRIAGAASTPDKPVGGWKKVAGILDTVFGNRQTPTWENKQASTSTKKSGSAKKSGGGGGGKSGGGGDSSGGGDPSVFGLDPQTDATPGEKIEGDRADDIPKEKKSLDVLSYNHGPLSAGVGTTGSGKASLDANATYKASDDLTLKATASALGKPGGGVEADYKDGDLTSKTKVSGATTGVEATEAVSVKSGGFTGSAMAGVKNDKGEGSAEAGYKLSSGLSVKADEKLDSSKGASTGAEIRYQAKSGFGIGADATVGKDGVQAGGMIHLGKKGGDGLDLSVTSGTKGISASATVQISHVRVGVVFKNGTIFTVMIDLGPGHEGVNEALRIALGIASAAVNPIPFGIGVAFRLARKLFGHKKKAKPAAPAQAAQGADSQTKGGAGVGPPGGGEPVAVLSSDDIDAMTGAGLVHPDGYLNLGLAPDAFADGLSNSSLDDTQRQALQATYAESDGWLPPADPSLADAGALDRMPAADDDGQGGGPQAS